MAYVMTMLELRMALNINLELNHGPLGLYGVKARVLLTKRRGESLRHVLMKLLGYMLFYHPELRVEMSAHQHYKPDLLRVDATGQPVQWIDCGQTALLKLDRISQRNPETWIDIIKATPGELALYQQHAQRRLRYPERVRYWSFEPTFISQLGALIQGRHEVIATVSEDYKALYLLIDGVTISSPIVYLAGTSSSLSSREPL